MTSRDVKSLIEQELGDNYFVSNTHNVDLRSCLVEPILEQYYTFDKKDSRHLWTVFEELPDRSGYKILYDANEEMFGLGVLTETDELICIGLYGDFMTTLESM